MASRSRPGVDQSSSARYSFSKLSDLERTLEELRENRARLTELVHDMPVECLVGPVRVVLTSDRQFAALSDALEDQIDERRNAASPGRMHGAGDFAK